MPTTQIPNDNLEFAHPRERCDECTGVVLVADKVPLVEGGEVTTLMLPSIHMLRIARDISTKAREALLRGETPHPHALIIAMLLDAHLIDRAILIRVVDGFFEDEHNEFDEAITLARDVVLAGYVGSSVCENFPDRIRLDVEDVFFDLCAAEEMAVAASLSNVDSIIPTTYEA